MRESRRVSHRLVDGILGKVSTAWNLAEDPSRVVGSVQTRARRAAPLEEDGKPGGRRRETRGGFEFAARSRQETREYEVRDEKVRSTEDYFWFMKVKSVRKRGYRCIVNDALFHTMRFFECCTDVRRARACFRLFLQTGKKNTKHLVELKISGA